MTTFVHIYIIRQIASLSLAKIIEANVGQAFTSGEFRHGDMQYSRRHSYCVTISFQSDQTHRRFRPRLIFKDELPSEHFRMAPCPRSYKMEPARQVEGVFNNLLTHHFCLLAQYLGIYLTK